MVAISSNSWENVMNINVMTLVLPNREWWTSCTGDATTYVATNTTTNEMYIPPQIEDKGLSSGVSGGSLSCIRSSTHSLHQPHTCICWPSVES